MANHTGTLFPRPPLFTNQSPSLKHSLLKCSAVIRKCEWAEVWIPVELTWQPLRSWLNLILKVSHQFTHTAGPHFVLFTASSSAEGQEIQHLLL